MSPKEFARSRRLFLQQASASMGYVAGILGAGGATARKAFAAAQARRRHLITIQGFGGWDTQWFYNCIKPSEAQYINPASLPSSVTKATLYHADRDNAGSITRRYDDIYTKRFDDSSASTAYIAAGSNSLGPVNFGLGAKQVYKRNPSIFQDIAFWRGMSYSNGHDIGNKVITHGNLSQYALSFSSLVAASLATDYPRPLHFVQVSNSPGDLRTNWAMATGYQVPVNIGDYTSFQNLTRASSDEFADLGRRSSINATIDALSKMLGGFQLRSSKTVFQGFQTAFDASVIVSGSNLADGPEFKYVWKSYVLELMNLVDDAFPPGGGSSDFQGSGSLISHYDDAGRNWWRYDLQNPGVDIAAAQNVSIDTSKWPSGKLSRTLPDLSTATTDAQKAALGVALGDFLEVYNKSPAGYYRNIVDTSFGYAMAFFLVKNDLSAVVDLSTPCGDAHDYNDVQAINLMFTHGCFRKLLEDLKNTGYGSGSLLDITTVVMSSEFDRMPNLSINVAVDERGTGHGYSTSVLLAGAGVKAGVYGGVKRGPGSFEMGPLGTSGNPTNDRFPMVSDGVTFGFGQPLPVDANGMPDPGGTIQNTRSVFPTVMKIFGINIPANQITDATYAPFIIKS